MKTGPTVNTVAENTSTPTITPTMNQSPSTPVVNTNASAQPVSPEQLQQEQHRADGGNNNNEKETFKEKFARLSHNCWESTGLCCFTAKEQSQIAALEFQISQRQKKFGVDYLTMVLAIQQEQLQQQEQFQNNNGDTVPPPPQAPIAETLERCVQEAVEDIRLLQGQIDSRMVTIDQRTVEVQSRIQPAPGTPSSQPTTAAAVLIDEGVEATPESNNDITEPSSRPSNTPPATAFASAPPAPSETANTNTAAETPPPITSPLATAETPKEPEKPAAGTM